MPLGKYRKLASEREMVREQRWIHLKLQRGDCGREGARPQPSPAASQGRDRTRPQQPFISERSQRRDLLVIADRGELCSVNHPVYYVPAYLYPQIDSSLHHQQHSESCLAKNAAAESRDGVRSGRTAGTRAGAAPRGGCPSRRDPAGGPRGALPRRVPGGQGSPSSGRGALGGKDGSEH